MCFCSIWTRLGLFEAGGHRTRPRQEAHDEERRRRGLPPAGGHGGTRAEADEEDQVGFPFSRQKTGSPTFVLTLVRREKYLPSFQSWFPVFLIFSFL